MPGTQVSVQPNCQSRFLHALVKLKQMRMAGANPDPDYFDHSFRWESAKAFHRQEKAAELDCAEFFAQYPLVLFGDIRKKTQSEMKLITGGPANAADPWIQCGQGLAH